MQVQGSPSSVIVRPGPLSGPASKVFGPSCPDGEPETRWCEGAGRPVRLWIEARDAFGNPHEVALSPVPFSISVAKKGSPGRVIASVSALNPNPNPKPQTPNPKP